MSTANAWLLDLGTPFRAAIGIRELIQIVEAPTTFAVPLTHAHSRHVMFWQNRMVPVTDLSIRMGAGRFDRKILALVGYQDSASQSTAVGAIVLAAPPVRIGVNDDQACALDEQNACWNGLAISCFDHDGASVPVLNLGRVFGSSD